MTPSYLAQIGFDAARCFAVSAFALSVGWPIGARLPRTRWSVALLLLPLLAPALLVSYAYAPVALRLTSQPALLLLAYSALIGLKLASLAAVARWLFPPSLPPEAQYCARLIERRSTFERLAFWLRTLGPTPWLVGSLAFLIAFTDFELASLLSVKSWPVKLFDAHAGGLELQNSLQLITAPLAIELTVLLAVLLMARNAPRQTLAPAAPRDRVRRWPLFVAAAITLIGAVIPISLVLFQAAQALPTIVYSGVMLQEIVTSLSFAIVGAGLAWVVAAIATSPRVGATLLIPGLFGGLVLALLVLALFQTTPLRFAYDTPAPLTLALAFLFAPVAFLLRWLLRTQNRAESLHLARMAGSRSLLWDLALSLRVIALGFVFLLAYFELTASALLAPVGFTPAFVRLHNLSHYGQTPILSLMLLAATLAPAALLALTLGLGRLYARRDAR
jgi:ABC-type Fe3+ transport system permease subunit